MKRVPFGRLAACLVLACAVVRFAGVVASGVTAVSSGDFAATLPGAYAENLNPTLWNSPDLPGAYRENGSYADWLGQKRTYLHGPTQFLTLYPIVFLDSYTAIARLLLVIYVGLMLLTCWVMSKSFDFISEGDTVSRKLLIYGSTFLFFPLLQALTQREFEVVILLALSLMYWAALRDKRPALGSLIAYIAWFKYFPLVVGPSYLIARRWWGAVAAFALTGVLIVALSELLFGVSLFFNNGNPGFVAAELTALSSSTAFCADWSPIQGTFTSIRWGLCGLRAHGFWVPVPFSYFALIAVTAFVGYVGLWSFEHRDQTPLESERWRRIWEISLVIIVNSIFFYTHYYYLSALILPLLALFIRFTSGAAIQKARLALAILAYVLLSAFVLPVSVLSAVFEVDVWQFYLGHQFYLFGELLLLALVLREYVALSVKVTGLKAALLPTRRHACGAAFTIVLAVSSLYWSAVLTAPLLEELTEQEVAGIRAPAERSDLPAQLILGDLFLAAEQGSVEAQLTLGDLYAAGDGVARDEAAAAGWYRRAAVQGDAEAIRWVRLAAEQGSVEARAILGSLYTAGNGIPQDLGEAERWYRLAAEQGHVAAQTNLAGMYANGRGVAQDVGEAVRWYRRAAAQGHD